eukprot:TRINITY_DN32765_c0_g1_i1.p1 TRINITY_DN32765_c0_g1~~TRINITY_DN32765_c0_g1_i1.p1  ORF type:complete len:131 (-),score=31.55 TRINITY_DN32765_c0_g1_i1:80-472(-)
MSDIYVRLLHVFFFLMIRRPPRSTQGVSSAASDVYKRQLMSDVLAFTHEGDSTVLITALSNSQTLRTAEMVDIKVVIIVRGKTIDKQLIELAEENGITLLRTEDAMFEVCLLYTSPSPRDLSTSRMPSSA